MLSASENYFFPCGTTRAVDHFDNSFVMSRMRTGLKPAVPARRSPTKLPPVRNGWGTNSPSSHSSSRDPEWAGDMVRGIQLKTTSKTSSAARNSPRRSSRSEEVNTPPLPKHEKKFSIPRETDKEKEIEVSHEHHALTQNHSKKYLWIWLYYYIILY